MRRLTSVKQYGLIEGALLALAPFALLMAHNKAGQFPALMPPLAAFFTAGCGLAAARLLFLNPRYGKLFGWLFWIGALVGTLPILIGNPFAALLFATFFIISGFALTDFKVDYQELLTTPRAERCRQRAAGAALVLGGAVLVSASLNQPDYLEARMCFILSALASLWLLLRWVRLSQRRHVSWFYSAATGMLLLPLLVSLVSGRTRAVALFIALLMSIPLYRFRRTAAPREHWWELVLNHPGRTLFSTFLTLCTFGALLLNLSFSTVRPEIPFIDKLFTAVSAVCVTGLSVLDISKEFTLTGQIFIMVLIQLGGLGIMTIATAAMHAIGKRLSLSQERLMSSLTASDHQDLTRSLKLILKFTFIVEGCGALLLAAGFMLDGLAPATALWHGCFTAVSAFCNAGFTLNSANLVPFAHNPLVLYPVSLLVVAGGIAPATALFLPAYFSGRTIPLAARLAITTTLVLLVAGTVSVLIFEWDKGLAGFGLAGKINNAWFQSATFRTAGFNSINVAAATTPTYIVMILYMFIGGSPGGTAGGVKTTTLAVLAITFWNNVTGSGDLNIQNRHISHYIVYRAVTIVMASGLVLLAATMMLTITQPIAPRELLFEVTSALATVGLSIGATPQLDGIGKVLIILTMFIGRIGPLTMFMLLDDAHSQTNAHYPYAKITLN